MDDLREALAAAVDEAKRQAWDEGYVDAVNSFVYRDGHSRIDAPAPGRNPYAVPQPAEIAAMRADAISHPNRKNHYCPSCAHNVIRLTDALDVARADLAAARKCIRETVDHYAPQPAEPGNGAMVVIAEQADEYKVIWRDDAAARQWHANDLYPEERWWEDANDDPMSWAAHIKYATHIYAVSDEPFWEM